MLQTCKITYLANDMEFISRNKGGWRASPPSQAHSPHCIEIFPKWEIFLLLGGRRRGFIFLFRKLDLHWILIFYFCLNEEESFNMFREMMICCIRLIFPIDSYWESIKVLNIFAEQCIFAISFWKSCTCYIWFKGRPRTLWINMKIRL